MLFKQLVAHFCMLKKYLVLFIFFSEAEDALAKLIFLIINICPSGFITVN